MLLTLIIERDKTYISNFVKKLCLAESFTAFVVCKKLICITKEIVLYKVNSSLHNHAVNPWHLLIHFLFVKGFKVIDKNEKEIILN